jgi:small subunit ribosomal protein S20
MPISASAKKSLRVGLRRTEENRAWKLRIKNQLKKASPTTLAETMSVLDKAAKHDVIHKNKAARLKSRLAKRFAGMTSEATEVKATPTKKAGPKKTTKK